MRRHSLRIHGNPALTLARQVARKRRAHMLAIIDPVAPHQRKVPLIDQAVAHLSMQAQQPTPALGQQQDARGLAIEPVRQFKKDLMRPRRAHPLDQAEIDATAAVHGQPRRLVDCQHMLVLEQHRRYLAPRWRRPHRYCCQPKRRHPYPVPHRKSLVDGGATAIDPHLAAANDPVHMALGNALRHP